MDKFTLLLATHRAHCYVHNMDTPDSDEIGPLFCYNGSLTVNVISCATGDAVDCYTYPDPITLDRFYADAKARGEEMWNE